MGIMTFKGIITSISPLYLERYFAAIKMISSYSFTSIFYLLNDYKLCLDDIYKVATIDFIYRLIDQITPDSPRKTFQNVTREIFKDGTFNWGRIVALFYFGYKMALKVG